MKPVMEQDKGFTLVELAIVMIIIGLLIGGVLQGQQLIRNAEVGATARKVKEIEAAANTFRDMFADLPGDLRQGDVRLPDCDEASNCGAENDGTSGNRRIDTDEPSDDPSEDGENIRFFQQMYAAQVLSGVDGENDNLFYGDSVPSAPVGGGFTIGYHYEGLLEKSFKTYEGSGEDDPGHYLTLRNDDLTDGDVAEGFLTNERAAQLDNKIDDGMADSGTVLGYSDTDFSESNLYPVVDGGGARIIDYGVYIKILN